MASVRMCWQQTVLDSTRAGRHVRLCGGLRNRPQPLSAAPRRRGLLPPPSPPATARTPKEGGRHRQDGPNLSPERIVGTISFCDWRALQHPDASCHQNCEYCRDGPTGPDRDRRWRLGLSYSPGRLSEEGRQSQSDGFLAMPAGAIGNEIADKWALDAATRESKRGEGDRAFGIPGGHAGPMSQTFVKTMLRKRANTMWREEIIRRCRGRRAFRIPRTGEIPRIPPGLRKAPREIASRFFQLASGHAMIAPFLKEKFGWVDVDSCWWQTEPGTSV